EKPGPIRWSPTVGSICGIKSCCFAMTFMGKARLPIENMSTARLNTLSKEVAAGFVRRAELVTLQQERLREMLRTILPGNPFYRAKLETAGINSESIATLNDLERLPFTTKAELTRDQIAHPPYGRDLTYEIEHYCRMHQTSGTAGRPLRWLDTA